MLPVFVTSSVSLFQSSHTSSILHR
uniref:Uncharacterized protein n=1 Tax=Anguilla anguilla TaxID=7936 RepID=A0A0E9U248_ANGAN